MQGFVNYCGLRHVPLRWVRIALIPESRRVIVQVSSGIERDEVVLDMRLVLDGVRACGVVDGS